MIVLEKYLIPFFGKMHVTRSAHETLQKFARWREQQMGRKPKVSTLNTHNAALDRVFDESVARGFMNKTHVPTLINKGRDSERRPDFTQEKYASMIRKLPHWINKTNTKVIHGDAYERLCVDNGQRRQVVRLLEGNLDLRWAKQTRTGFCDLVIGLLKLVMEQKAWQNATTY